MRGLRVTMVTAIAVVAIAALEVAADEPPTALTFVQRLDAASRDLLGRPYVLGPLGEEAPPDPDPRFRLDAFDCTTYVETVLAIALEGEGAGGEDATRRRLDRIRYRDGVATFAARRHLIDAQWIPGLEKDGLLRDVTRQVGGRATRTATLRLTRAAWAKSTLATDLGLAWDAVPHGRQTLDYLPWTELEREEVRAVLPPIAILNLVANPTSTAPTLVIHQALLLRAPDGAWIARHASSSSHRVVEEPLDVFLTHSRARRSGTALGLNVLAIVGVDG